MIPKDITLYVLCKKTHSINLCSIQTDVARLVLQTKIVFQLNKREQLVDWAQKIHRTSSVNEDQNNGKQK